MPAATAPNAFILDADEALLEEYSPDKTRYWRDHGIIAVVLMALAGSVLWLIGSAYPAIGSLGAILAVAVRASYLASETLSMRWVLTNRRLILPGGVRSVPLLDIETVRTLLGDVQVISKSGDKHLLKHMADSEGVVSRLLAARAACVNQRS